MLCLAVLMYFDFKMLLIQCTKNKKRYQIFCQFLHAPCGIFLFIFVLISSRFARRRRKILGRIFVPMEILKVLNEKHHYLILFQALELKKFWHFSGFRLPTLSERISSHVFLYATKQEPSAPFWRCFLNFD